MYSRANWSSLQEELVNISNSVTSMFKDGYDVQELWNRFKCSLLEAVDRFIPSKQSKKGYNLPWIDRSIRKILRRKKRLYTRAKRHQNWSNYRNFQKECRRELRKAESEWEYVNKTIQELRRPCIQQLQAILDICEVKASGKPRGLTTERGQLLDVRHRNKGKTSH